MPSMKELAMGLSRAEEPSHAGGSMFEAVMISDELIAFYPQGRVRRKQYVILFNPVSGIFRKVHLR